MGFIYVIVSGLIVISVLNGGEMFYLLKFDIEFYWCWIIV